MSSETSAVLVAVRIRPFHNREDPMTCTVTVADSKTITISDVPAAAATLAGAGLSSSSALSATGGGTAASSSAGRETVGATGDSALAKLAKEGLAKHFYTFDKIFWSVPPSVLPLPPAKLARTAQALSGASSSLFAAAGSDGVGTESRRDGDSLSASMRSSMQTSTAHNNNNSNNNNNNSSFGGSSDAKVMLRQQQVMTVAQQLPCFHRAATYEDQAAVYGFIGPRLSHAIMSGFNACIFAYGQTGSGKSYSMIGQADKLPSLSSSTSSSSAVARASDAELGLMPRLARDLFDKMKAERGLDEAVSFNVEVSFFEIYCEKVRDLLASFNESGGTSSAGGGSMRIRQHPSRGPYVEGLSHVRVRDADQVMRCLQTGLRDRSTAETRMNEHSSRSHAIMQIHVTKVTVVPEETTVTTKTRVCKANMVDLAGSERVTQSGATGDRLEEAKNINLSLSTLGRVIQQLSEKQTGKNVVPAYRDSVLTWLLSDSLGGNSKTIMLATVAPSAYCYHQTLNTLRFAGVAKKVINVATVNEDQHFQQLVMELRQQIVKLTLQLEGGKAAQVHMEEIRQLKEDKETLLVQNDALRVKTANMMDTADVHAMRRRNTELEELNQQLSQEKVQLQQRLLASSSALREDLAKQRQQVFTLQEQLENKEQQLSDQGTSSATSGRDKARTSLSRGRDEGDSSAVTKPSDAAALASAQAELRKLQLQLARETDEKSVLKQKLHAALRDLGSAKQAEQDAKDGAAAARQGREEYQKRWTDAQQLADGLQKRLDTTLDLLETTQANLTVLRSDSTTEAARQRAAESARESLLASQLEQTRQDYLNEKQANVQLLLRVSRVEQERSQLKQQMNTMQADVHELEQLLLEETESSERHYTRMRYHRSLTEVLQYMLRSLSHDTQQLSAAATRRNSYGVGAASVIGLSPRASSFALGSSLNGSPRGAAWGDVSSPKSPFSQALTMGHSATSDALAVSFSAQNTNFTNELYLAQLEYELFCEESQQRGLVVQEFLASSNRIWAQRARLYQAQTASETARYAEARDRLDVLHDEAASLQRKVKELEEALAEADAQQAASNQTIASHEVNVLTLTRQLRTAEEARADRARELETLIERVVTAEAAKEDAEARLRESMAADELEVNAEAGANEKNASETRQDGPRGRSVSHRALADERVAELEAQCQSYQQELGLVRASVDRDSASRSAQVEKAQREKLVLQAEVQRLTEAKEKLADALSATEQEQTQRAGQQQRMIDTLRGALEEETRMADACRQASQQADVARSGLEDALIASRAACDELQTQKQGLEARYDALEVEVTELRQHYSGMERQLMALQAREPELYLLLEKGAAESSVEWIGKARLERANLQKQKQEARRMNSELLQHVRQRTTHLRDVQRQLWDLPSSTPTATPSALSTAHSSVSTPLANSRRGHAEGNGGAVQRPLDLDQHSMGTLSSAAHSSGTSPTAQDPKPPQARTS